MNKTGEAVQAHHLVGHRRSLGVAPATRPRPATADDHPARKPARYSAVKARTGFLATAELHHRGYDRRHPIRPSRGAGVHVASGAPESEQNRRCGFLTACRFEATLIPFTFNSATRQETIAWKAIKVRRGPVPARPAPADRRRDAARRASLPPWRNPCLRRGVREKDR